MFLCLNNEVYISHLQETRNQPVQQIITHDNFLFSGDEMAIRNKPIIGNEISGGPF